MSLTPWLWKELHDLFDTADGSLPEIRVNYHDTVSIANGYALLRERASKTPPEDAYFWSRVHNEARPLDSVPNPAALVVSGDAEAFHVLFGGIKSLGVTIPDLGVFVFPDQLALDYTMGPAWGPAELEALFELLAELSALDPRSSLSLEEGVLPEVVARFQKAWQRWLSERAT